MSVRIKFFYRSWTGAWIPSYWVHISSTFLEVGQARPPCLSGISGFWIFVWASTGCTGSFLFSFLFLCSFFLLVRVALKLRGLRFHPPRLCRLAVFLIHTNVSLWKRSWTGSWIPRTARRQSGSSIFLDRLSIYRSRRYVVTLLGPLMAVNCSRRYVVTLLGPWLDGLWQSPVWGHLTWTVARRLIAVTGMGSFDLDR